MTKPTSGELAIFRQFPQDVPRRYVSVCPRTPIFKAQVNGAALTDSKTGGIYALHYDNVTVGAYTDIHVGQSLDIGTTPGARDIGTTRVRKTPTSNTLYIAETAPGKLPVADNYYVTVVDEYRLWQKLWRLVPVKNNAGYNTGFTQYKDYDLAYSDYGSKPLPVVNVMLGVTSDGEYIPYKPAGWVDDGETFRTVTLHAVIVPIAKSATSGTITWDVGDGTIISGTVNSATIVVTYPASTTHRYCGVTGTDSNGKTGERVFEIWVHDDDHPPLTVFNPPARDESAEGRDVQIVFFGDDDSADETVIPRGCPCCYWEAAEFGDDPAPDPYNGQFLGWATKEATLFKTDESTWTLDIGGTATWLKNAGGPSDSITYKSSPNRWNFSKSITMDRLMAYDLQNHTTACLVVNFKPSGNLDESKGENLNESSIWEQLRYVAKAKLNYEVYCHSLGDIVVKPKLSLQRTSTLRNAIPVQVHLTSADWTHDSGLELATELQERVGLTEVGGKSWDLSKERKKLARAPGKTPAGPPAKENPQGVILPTSDTLNALLDLAGDYWALLNTPRPETSITLLGNMDFVEPGDVIEVTSDIPNPRGETLTAQRFTVTRIARQHNSDPQQPDKVLTWTVEQETDGNPGQEQTIATSKTNTGGVTLSNIAFPAVNWPFIVGGDVASLVHGTGSYVMPMSDMTLKRTTNYSDNNPSWADSLSLSTLGMNGTTLIDGVSDPFSPKYITRDATQVNGWVCSDVQVGRVTGVEPGGTPVFTAGLTFRGTTTNRNIQTERGAGEQNWALVISHYASAGGTYATHTLDGLTWSAEVQITPGSPTSGSFIAGVWMDPRLPGHAITTAIVSGSGQTAQAQAYETFDYGATWAPTSDPNINPNHTMALWIEGPYADTTASIFYYTKLTSVGVSQYTIGMRKAVGAALSEVSPTVSAVTYGPRWHRGVRAWDGDANKLLCVGLNNNGGLGVCKTGLFKSLNAASAWQTVVAPDLANYDLYHGCAIGGDGLACYVWGKGRIFYSADFLATPLVDKTGDLVSTADVLSIWGA